jgi:diguanylate cyclase (GGDEF)-like protein
MRSLLRFAFPGGFVLAAAALFWRPVAASDWMASVGPLFATLLWGLGVLLALLFKQVRAAVIQGGLILLWAAIGAVGLGDDALLYRFLLVHLPLAALLVLVLPQQGLLRADKGLAVLVFVLHPAAVTLLLTSRPEWAAAVVDWPPLLWTARLLAGALLWLPALALALWRWRRRGDVMDAGLFWAFPAVWLGLLWMPRLDAARMAWLAGGVILILAVLEKAYRFAYRDELTGIPSRRAMAEQVESLGGQFAVAMVDIDHFKAINDTYGHAVGDQVLRKVASRVEAVGGGGKAFRYGGEEFAVLFPGKTRREAIPHLQAMRQAVEKDLFVLRHWTRPSKQPKRPMKTSGRKASSQNIKVTVSVGVAESGGELAAPHEVVKAADKALYRAKDAGRNCLVTG